MEKRRVGPIDCGKAALGKRMIAVQVIGGLGNQMFQYAAGRALAERNRLPLRLDTSSFGTYKLHNGFELKRIFAGSMTVATAADIKFILGWRSRPTIRKLLLRPSAKSFRGANIIVEPHYQYWPGINRSPSLAYLSGYWQSEKYFKANEAEIRDAFAFKQVMSDSNSRLAEEIQRINSVSIHVRRGDYVTNMNTKAVHGECTLDYYQQAIRHVAERLDQPKFYFFSDDIGWTKENLKFDFPHCYVDTNFGMESYNDMWLMSLCKHQIIANSSFSWWGAWLNSNPEKLVIAPQKWFKNDNDLSDLIPQNWTTI